MIVLQGKSVFKGIAIGRLLFYKRKQNEILKIIIEDVEKEIERFHKAQEIATGELQELYVKALNDTNKESAMIFEVHQMMVKDIEYVESVEGIIKADKVNAEYAVKATADNLAAIFEAMEDEYMRERGADIKDISERIINILISGGNEKLKIDEPSIVAADDLVPSETVQLDKSKILGFTTIKGSSNSHTAILARTMNIPAIVNVGEDLKEEYDGQQVILDGFTGKVYIEPDEETLSKLQSKQKEEAAKRRLLHKLKGKETITADGKKINLYANIGNVSDLESVLENDAEGIGLFRSEFLYLENDNYPTEEQQFKVYKEVAERMEGKKVIIRTLDIGADKQADYLNLPKEQNPAMGYRAIRICLEEREIFKTQLRAIYRAAAYGNISIMFPMIISLEEVRAIKEIIETVKEELRNEGIAFKDNVELGIMIETPAAVMISDLLAKEVDFFSIGTNDLVQYTLAIDRQNPMLDKIYDPHHPAILRMLKMVVDSAHKEGKWVGICGELGADLELTETFLNMGFDEISVSPAFVLEIREKVRNTNIL